MEDRPQLRFIDPDILSRIGSMELRAKTVVEGFLSGLHQSPYRGFSVEFAEYRQYAPGDDIRHIDWKVYARSDRYYVKEFEEETNLNCHLLLDVSGSMAYASAKLSKLEYASYLAASLAYFMARQHDGVGLVTFDKEVVDYIPARARPGHLLSLLMTLDKVQAGEETQLSQPLHHVADLVTKKGLIVLISDLLDDPASVLEALQHFRFQGHDVIVFHIMDQAELTFPFHNLSRFIDLESPRQVVAIPELVRDDYMRNLEEHLRTLRRGCGERRVDYVLMNTSKALDFALFAYLAKRAGKA
jgi:uncharacterized protein (DUF58 family)